MDLPVGGQVRVFRYNLRAPLTVASGASQSAFVLVTGNQVVTGTVSQNANLAIANAQHGLGNGVLSLYFVTTTRVYRANTANITSGNVTWISDNIAEIPPGGTGTFALTSALSTIEYMDSIDAFIVGTTHATSNFSYITKYVASGTQFEYMFGRDFKYLEHGAKDNGHPSIFSNQITPMAFSDAGANRLYAVKQGTTAQTNHIYVLPFGCDWNYAGSTNGRLITPAISAPNATKFYEAFVNNVRYL